MRTPDKEAELNKLDNVIVQRLDVTDSGSIKSAVNAGLEKFGTIDVLLNNAGYGKRLKVGTGSTGKFCLDPPWPLFPFMRHF